MMRSIIRRAVARAIAAAAIALGGAGCSSSAHTAPSARTSSIPPTSPAAIERMIQGVHAARAPLQADHERAVALLREAVGLDGNLWEARYDLGVVLAAAGDLAGAEEQLTVVAHLARDEENAAVALAEVRRRREEHKLAADGLADFVHDHPEALAARTLYVAALRESGQVDKAIAEASEVLARKPADATALAELSLSHLEKGDKDAAALLAKQAVEANPNSAVAHRATGLLDLANGDDATAFSEFRKAAQADPRDTTSRLNMGVVLLHAGAYAKAEEQYREILRQSPDNAPAEVGLAAALRGAADGRHPHNLDEARALLEKVLAADSHNTSALFNLAVLMADFVKKPTEAAPLFKRFLADAPAAHPLRAEAERYVAAAAASGAPKDVSHGPR